MLKVALKSLTKLSISKEDWVHAYKLASTSISVAHKLRAQDAQIAYHNCGLVAVGASRALRELKKHKRVLTLNVFVCPLDQYL